MIIKFEKSATAENTWVTPMLEYGPRKYARTFISKRFPKCKIDSWKLSGNYYGNLIITFKNREDIDFFLILTSDGIEI
jgi:hypothetical protein